MKTLYFEGAGFNGANADYNGLNCRIRTAFTNDHGKKIYLEILAGKRNKYQDKSIPNVYGIIDFCHYITNDPEIDDCNESIVKYKGERVERNTIYFDYTLENIKNFVNSNLCCSFDEVVILPDYAGYRVHGDGKKGTIEQYNYGDEFIYNEELTAKITAKVEELKRYHEKVLNMKYDNTSYWREGDSLRYRINTYQESLDKAGIKDRDGVVNF